MVLSVTMPTLPPKGVHFAQNLPLGHPAHRRIARHLGDGIHVHRHEKHLGAQVGGRSGGFATRVAGSYYNDIVLFLLKH